MLVFGGKVCSCTSKAWSTVALTVVIATTVAVIATYRTGTLSEDSLRKALNTLGVFGLNPNGSKQVGRMTVLDDTNEDPRNLRLLFKGDSRTTLRENMSADDADDNFFSYMSHLHYHCEDYIRLGNSFDGGWDMCLVGPYRPHKPCLIYSFGINNDFSFDDAASIMFGCTIRAFDPSMSNKDHRRGPNIWFYQVGIGGKDETNSNGWRIRTLDSLVRDYNDTGKVIDYLKMDVEGAEWSSLKAMYLTNILDRVKQFGLEIHVSSKSFYLFYSILSVLEERGFRRWYWALNFRGSNIYMARPGASRSCCYEMVYINTKYLKGIESL